MKRLPKNLRKEIIFSRDSSGAMIATVDASKHLAEIQEASQSRTRDRQLQNTYGISLEDYNKLLAQQGRKCAIRGKHQSEFGYPLYVDHNHQTEKVRGLLCAGCNTGLGHFEKYGKQMQNYLDTGVPSVTIIPSVTSIGTRND